MRVPGAQEEQKMALNLEDPDSPALPLWAM